jgi:hypothetical protein
MVVFRLGLSASIIIAAGPACRAQESGYLSYAKERVQLDAVRAHDDPSTPWHNLLQRLKERAKSDAGGEASAPAVDATPWGPAGAHVLVSAVTPTKGVFYISEYGPWGMERGPAAPGRQISVCRFTINWDRLPGGPYVPGLLWASWAFPNVDCRPPTAPGLSPLAEWRRNSETAAYSVAARERQSGLAATVVRETWSRSAPVQPIDAARALTLIIAADDRVMRAVPLSQDVPLYARTAHGRTFFGMTVPGNNEKVCLVEGLRWADVAGTDRPALHRARDMCAALFRRSVPTRREGDRPVIMPRQR